MNAKEHFATAVHEASHAVVAEAHFKIGAYPEITPDGRSKLLATQGDHSGLCHFEYQPTEFESAVISWAGPMGQAMYATTPDWFPPFKPSQKMLKDWFSMMMQQINRLSDGDRRGIHAYKNTWRSCKSAFAVLVENRARITRLAKALAKSQERSDREADESKWRGIPRPKAFPATHADFVNLICSNDAEKFNAFVVSRAALHLTCNDTASIDEAKQRFHTGFDDAYTTSMNLQKQIYGGDFSGADSWLRAARDYQQWAASNTAIQSERH